MSLNLSSASLCGDAHKSYEVYSQELLTALEERKGNYQKAWSAVTKLMALTVHELYRSRQHIFLQFKSVTLRSVLAGLRVLARNIQNLAQSAGRRWSIPFDHPAVDYIFSEAVGTLVETMREAECDEHNIELVLRLFRDNIAIREPEIRKLLESGQFASGLEQR